MLDEFLNIGNFEEALQEITEKFSKKTISTFIEIVIEMVIKSKIQYKFMIYLFFRFSRRTLEPGLRPAR